MPIAVKMMATIIMNHIVAMVLPRLFSSESSEARARYETLDRLKPMPHAPKASTPISTPRPKLSAMRNATCGETTTPATQRSRPRKMYGVRRRPKMGWRSEYEPMATCRGEKR